VNTRLYLRWLRVEEVWLRVEGVWLRVEGVWLRLILFTPDSYMDISEVFRMARRSFSSCRKTCLLSGVTLTSTHSESSRTSRL